MDMSDYQVRAHLTATTDDLDVYILGLIGEAGSVASSVKKYKRDAPSAAQVKRDISEEIGDVIWYAAEIASRCDIDLKDVAAQNLKKTEYLFKGKDADFDEGFPEGERFPRILEVQFGVEGGPNVIRIDGKAVGDPLMDNSYDDDGYRYHDVFHLSYMTVLGWSPVLRKLMKRKRKSSPQVDEVEDGARALVLEEGISILVFSQSQPPEHGPTLFSERGNVPFWILENIKKMTINLEVGARSVGQWRRAIGEGFKVFDQLRANAGGIVTCNLETKTLTYRKDVTA